MKQIIDYIKEGLKINSKTKVNSCKLTFQELMKKYGDEENNSQELDSYYDYITLDDKYDEHINKIMNLNVHDWSKFYDDFMEEQKKYNNPKDKYEIHIWRGASLKIDCRISNTEILSRIEIEKNKFNNKFVLNYDLLKNDLAKKYNDIEQSLVQAFEYMMNMKL